jgi:hypothetical protein
MKKTITLSAVLFAALLQGGAKAQAPKFVLFEHFTQASCGPCASQNPAFENNILLPNEKVVRHIAYHTSWPGTDPMHTHNPTENAARTSYYGVSGVPSVTMQGNHKTGSPARFSQKDIDTQFASLSPIKIKVTEAISGADRNVTVDIKTVGTVPAGDYKLRIAVIENPIDYTTPPGSNGEKHFPNVFRKMLPNTAGEAITLSAAGGTSSFNFTYNDHPDWISGNIKLVAFVQNDLTKEILNVGTNNDPEINYAIATQDFVKKGMPSTASSFSISAYNIGDNSESFIYSLTSSAPADWNSNFTLAGMPYTSTATVTANPNSTNAIVLNVTPGNTPAVGEYIFTIKSAAHPASPEMVKRFYVISGVTDLIVNNSAPVGDPAIPGNAFTWESVFKNGLQSANNQGTASANEEVTAAAIKTNAFDGVKNIYFNIGWTFPSFTDEVVTRLKSFLDGGGNMFISGQDIGWDVFDQNGNGTQLQKDFYKTYLGATYVADGSGSNGQLTTVATDEIWGSMANSAINKTFYNSHIYPDELKAEPGAHAIYRYNTSTTKVAGVRKETAAYKVVYLGVGLEQLASPTDQNAILKLAHDWFYGLLSTSVFDEAMEKLGQIYPNPNSGVAYIPVNLGDENATIEIMDLSGRVLQINRIPSGTNLVEINTANLINGLYIYRINSNNSSSKGKLMQVTK